MTNILCAACRPSTYQIKTHTAKTILDKDFQLGESGTLWYLHARCYSVPGTSRDRIFLLQGSWLVFSTSPILTFPSSLLSSSWCFVRCHWLEHLLILKKWASWVPVATGVFMSVSSWQWSFCTLQDQFEHVARSCRFPASKTALQHVFPGLKNGCFSMPLSKSTTTTMLLRRLAVWWSQHTADALRAPNSAHCLVTWCLQLLSAQCQASDTSFRRGLPAGDFSRLFRSSSHLAMPVCCIWKSSTASFNQSNHTLRSLLQCKGKTSIVR